MGTPLRVLLAHKFFRVTGGADVFFFEVGRVLEAYGHRVAWFSTSHPENRAGEFNRYFVDPPNYTEGSLLKRSLGIGRMIYSRAARAKFAQLIEDFRPDIIHVFAIHVHLSPSILDAARDAGIPVVMSCNDFKHICPNYKLFHHGKLCSDCRGGHFYHAVKNRCCKDSLAFSAASAMEAYVHRALGIYHRDIHTYLFASKFMAWETKRFWGDDAFRWDVLRNPFDSRKFQFSERNEDYLLYFGRLSDEKGVDVLLRAAAHVPEAKIRIVGEGPDEARLKRLASHLSLNNVEFLGPMWGSALNEVLAGARFVVVPSVWHENFPYVINQAFAYGKPVIGSDLGGIPELVQHRERGLIFPSGDVVALADAISSLWNTPVWTQAMGRAAKTWSDKEFNDEKFYEQLSRIYLEVLG